MGFKDHFSSHSSDYARFRPTYPAELFQYLAGISPGRSLAWDCATGNGQAAVALAEHFERVVATDASRQQLENAQSHRAVEYRHCPAERTDLADREVDLTVVAQALHWFDFDPFFAEVRRVTAPAGLLAVLSYGVFRMSSEIDRAVAIYYQETVGDFWPPERRYIDEEYRTIPFPFEELSTPAFRMEAEWRIEHLLGYLSTWSASVRYQNQYGADPVEAVRPALVKAWGEFELRTVRWPLYFRVGRI